jgi:hypothetical protein
MMCFIPSESFFMSLSHLTLLSLGPGFHFMDLPEAVPHMTRLLAIQLKGNHHIELEELPSLSPLTALQELHLSDFEWLRSSYRDLTVVGRAREYRNIATLHCLLVR